MKRFVLSVVLLAGLSGCASTPAAEPVSASPTPVVLTPGEYEFQPLTGGKGVLSLPGEAPADIEALRALVKGSKPTYITAVVDNREGTADLNMYGVSIFTADGEELKYEGASSYVDSLDKKLPENAPAETSNRFVEAYNKHNDTVSPLGKKTFTLVGPPIPAEFTGVKVYPAGAYDPVDALPKS
jgi:hypothetical protein